LQVNVHSFKMLRRKYEWVDGWLLKIKNEIWHCIYLHFTIQCSRQSRLAVLMNNTKWSNKTRLKILWSFVPIFKIFSFLFFSFFLSFFFFFLGNSLHVMWFPVTTAILGLGMEDMTSRYGRWLWMYWISSHGEPTRDGPPAWGFGKGPTTPHCKKSACYMLHMASELDKILWNDLDNSEWIWDLKHGMLWGSTGKVTENSCTKVHLMAV
jgi:hypothetical protein